jgi:hypothetical protein
VLVIAILSFWVTVAFEKRGLVGSGTRICAVIKLKSMTCSVKEVSVFLYAMEPDYWEEKWLSKKATSPWGD